MQNELRKSFTSKPQGKRIVVGGLSPFNETLLEGEDEMEFVGEVPTRLTWILNNGDSQKVLEGLTRYIELGHLTALMGPSAFGKSRLLVALSSQLAANCFLCGTILSKVN